MPALDNRSTVIAYRNGCGCKIGAGRGVGNLEIAIFKGGGAAASLNHRADCAVTVTPWKDTGLRGIVSMVKALPWVL